MVLELLELALLRMYAPARNIPGADMDGPYQHILHWPPPGEKNYLRGGGAVDIARGRDLWDMHRDGVCIITSFSSSRGLASLYPSCVKSWVGMAARIANHAGTT